MGFQLNAVFSSPVDQERKQDVLVSAVVRWPFIRLPRRQDCYTESAHFALPELTAYLYQDENAYERALEQCRQVEGSLPDLSTEFPSVAFALIEVECFGGTCLYGGLVYKAGRVGLRQEPDAYGHRRLLEQVGITLTDNRFTPFERGYFAANSSR